jgi:hypothetical protein
MSKNFDLLSPLKKWVLTNKYFIKTTEPKEKKASASHYLLDGGIWKVPNDKYLEFLQLLSVDLQNNEKHYICENRTEVFKFICDLDFYEETQITVDQIKIFVNVLQLVVQEYFGDKHVIICGSDSKINTINGQEYVKSGFHLIWPKIWITVQTAKTIRMIFIEKLTEKFGIRSDINSWSDVVDLAVYEDNGLRMVGCRKIVFCKACKNKKEARETCEPCNQSGKIDENRVYKPVGVIPENNEYSLSLRDYYVLLLETSIYNYNSIGETVLIKELPELVVSKKKKPLKQEKQDELTSKLENFIKKNFKDTHGKIKLKKITKYDQCYFAEPDENFCINVNRTHTSSGVYFHVKSSGISQRCFCKKDTTTDRLHGPCKDYISKEIPLSKILQSFLFGPSSSKSNKKEINFLTISRSNSTTALLDLSVTKKINPNSINKEACLNNCKNILWKLEHDLVKKK